MDKIEKINLNSVVAKSNELVPKLAKYDLQELRLIAYCLAHYDSRKPDNRKFTARVDELAKIFPSMGEHTAYDVIKKAVLDINNKPIEFRNEGKRHLWIWFAGFCYHEREGVFEFSISPLLEPFLLELKERFSMYRLGDVHQFQAASTWKLYEQLNVHKFTGAWLATVDELRELFNVDGKYNRFDSLRQRLIDPSLIEINDKSNLSVDYVREREGKKVKYIRFFIQTKEKVYIDEEQHTQNMLLRLLLQAGIKHETATKLLHSFAELGKEAYFLKKVPEIMKRWTEAKGPMARYVTGALKKELYNVRCDSRPYAEAYRCWVAKKMTQTKCKVRIRGKAGNRHKCKMCLLHMPPDKLGV